MDKGDIYGHPRKSRTIVKRCRNQTFIRKHSKRTNNRTRMQRLQVLAQFIKPISENTETNRVYEIEIIGHLMLHGLTQEEIDRTLKESKEDYINLKTLGDNQISSHSVKEIETWLIDAKAMLDSTKNVSQGSYQSLSQRIIQIRRLYESLRSYVISKLTFYQQVLNMVQTQQNQPESTRSFDMRKVFIVHGHNGEIKEAIARLIEKQGIEAIILHEQANQGATIIEKFERNSDVGCAVCLFTADDLGRAKTDPEDKMRARQNVVFEAGYFIGKLGRDRVILIADRGVEIPSDLQGVVYTETNNWQYSVLKELKAIGYNIDYNKLD